MKNVLWMKTVAKKWDPMTKDYLCFPETLMCGNK